MKAAVVNEYGAGFDIEHIEIDTPRDHEVLVEVRAAGLCHSDLHVADGTIPFGLPIVLGHEIAGIVHETGTAVTTLRPGDHVVGSLVQWCGECRACRAGRSYQCERPGATLRDADDRPRLRRHGESLIQGYGLGGFAEFALVHEHQLAQVSAEVPFPQAALLGCGVATGVGAAVNTADVRPGETVVVIGAGGVGLNVVSGAQLAGASRIIALDLQPHKRELALAFGATEVIDPADGDIVEAVLAATEGGADHVFEVVGLKSTSEQALAFARRGGAVYLIGLHSPGSKIEIDAQSELIRGQKRIQGVSMGSAVMDRDVPRYADLYLQGRLDLDSLVSREVRLDEIDAAYEELEGGSIARSVVTSF
jgi:S-(hydroxymethyl)glutathione dehydrogenase/alcohol dehydrogenase